MEIPKHTKDCRRKKWKYCQYQGCDRQYFGYGMAKYCEIHTNPKMRERKRRVYDPVTLNNVVIHAHRIVGEMIELDCGLPGCTEKVRFQIYSRQMVYPKYCTEHRNEYRRQLFERQRKNLTVPV